MRITNARLADGRLVDIEIADGSIQALRDHSDEPVPNHETVDVGGWLLLPAMVEPHAHLDKALTAESVPNPTGDLAGAIEAWIAAAERGVFTHEEMVTRIGDALDRLLLNGVTAVRSHVNCGATSGLRHLVAAQHAVEPYRSLLHAEFVALPHAPLCGADGEDSRAALRAAAAAGVELLGGCPHLEPDGVGSIGVVLDIAADTSRRVDLHVDETLDPSILTLRDLARSVVDRGIEGTVTASHCVSLGVQPPDVQAEVAAKVAGAGLSVVALPQTNLFLQGRAHPSSTPRGLTALHALRAAGANVSAGADNVQDPFNLVGRSDPLETAALLVMAGHVLPEDAYDMVSNTARRTMGLRTVDFEPGDPADFVAIDAPSIRAAIADAPANRMTFHRGRLVARSTTTTEIVGGSRSPGGRASLR